MKQDPNVTPGRPEESGLTPAEQPAKVGGLPADATDWAALPGMVPPEPFVRTAWDRVFALVFYGLAYLYVRLVFDRGLLAGGSSAAVFAAVYAALVLAYFVVRGIRPAAFSWLWLAALLSLGLSFALWPNESLLGFDVLALHAVAVYWPLCAAGVTLRPATSSMLPADLLNGLIIVPFGNFFSQLRCLFGGWRLRKAGTGKRLLQILLGAAVLLLLLLAVVPLLMRADDAFARLLERAAALFRVELQLELWPLVAALPVGCFLFGLAYGCVSRRHTGHLQLEKLREWGEDCRVLPPLTVHIVLVGVCVVYTLFVAVDAPGLFSAFAGRLSGTEVYSEFAREGFFELCRVAAINSLVLLGLNLLSAVPRLESRTLRALNLLLSALTLLILASAAGKMLLYIRVYGLTPKRVLTMAFMAMLAVLFGGTAVWQFRRFNLIRLAAGFAAALFCALALCNLDGLIATYNAAHGLLAPL